MLVLIDESGCPGFKLMAGSAANFVVAMVRFEDFAEAERASAAIDEARERLQVKPEFKFGKCKKDRRDEFFQSSAPFDFRVRAIVVRKDRVWSPNLRSRTDRFYNFFMRCMLTHDSGTLKDAKIKVDGSGSRQFKRAMTVYLRRMLEPGKIQSFKFVNSRNDNLIQLADMCAGAIARSYNTEFRDDAYRWRLALREKIENVWEFK